MKRGKFFRTGHAAGKAAGSWTVDGNTSAETCARILRGIEEGDPEVMDMRPAPLSGEHAGESIPELFGYRPRDAWLSLYEEGYTEGFWQEVERAARYQVSE